MGKKRLDMKLITKACTRAHGSSVSKSLYNNTKNQFWIFTFVFITSRPSQSTKSNCKDLKKHSYTCTYKCIHTHTHTHPEAKPEAHTHTRTHRWPQSLPHCQYNYCAQLFWWIFHYVCISCLAGAIRGSDSKFRWDTHNYIPLLREATALCPLLNSINEGNNISYGNPSETWLLNY